MKKKKKDSSIEIWTNAVKRYFIKEYARIKIKHREDVHLVKYRLKSQRNTSTCSDVYD